MNAVKTLAMVVAAAGAFVLWDALKPEGGLGAVVDQVASRGASAGPAGPRGFVEIPMPDGLPSRGVVVFAPANCPEDAGQRADAIVRHLESQGIPHRRSSSANYSNLASAEDARRVTAVMNGPIPVVYVNGRARANPSPQDVVAEYRGGG
ncbi:hypothetical protein WCE34_08315 [Luteimonas sp. MJ204]|uniref:hypothetical protein n=1 Tax=Luteimonas TaxID=83614 RepID=UPI0031BAA220